MGCIIKSLVIYCQQNQNKVQSQRPDYIPAPRQNLVLTLSGTLAALSHWFADPDFIGILCPKSARHFHPSSQKVHKGFEKYIRAPLNESVPPLGKPIHSDAPDSFKLP
jgi:hypothetical protein